MRNLIALSLLLLVGCGSGEDNKTSSSSISSVCVGGNTEVTVPEEQIEQIIAEEESEGDGDPIVVEDAGSLNQDGALRLAKIVIIGDCNDVHTEDNDVVSDDDTNVQLGQQN